MNQPPFSATRPVKPRRWLRFMVKSFLALILLFVIAWFVVTSSFFFKHFILPRVSKAANATVTVDQAVISPFSHIILRNLKVRTMGSEPLLTVAEVRLRYHLMDILRGHFDVDEVAVVSPVINLVENPDGTSNLDPLLKSQPKKETKETKPGSPTTSSQSSKPLRVDLKRFALTNATVRVTKNYSGGLQDVTEITNVNITLTDLQNGGSGKLQLNAGVNIDNQPPAPATNGNLQAQIAGNFTFTLADDLKPLAIEGNTHLDVTQAGGAMRDLAALGVNFDCDTTPTNITQIALRFQKAGVSLGALQVSGPFDMAKTEGRLNVAVVGLDQRVLNLLGAADGIDFGGTSINSINQIELDKSGSILTATGQFTVAGLQMTRAGQSTPTLDATASYNVTVDGGAQNVLLNTLSLTATQNRHPFAQVQLSSPMSLCWGKTNTAGGNATLDFTLAGLNLADWKPVLGEMISGGDVNLEAKLVSQSGGQQLAFEFGSQMTNLSAALGGNQIANAGIDLQMRGQAVNFKQFKLDEYRLQVKQADRALLTVSATGSCEPATQNADLQFQVQSALAGLVGLLPQPGVNVSSGALDLTGQLTQKDQTQTVTGTLALTSLTGTVGKNGFHNFGATANWNATASAGRIQISQLAGRLTGDGNAGGSFEVSGDYDLNKKSGQLTAKLADFNQNGLRPFLQPLFGDKKLVSIAVNTDAAATFDLHNDDSVKADLQVTNLVVSDPAGRFPATPLEAKVQLDAACHKQIADLRRLQITLTPTVRAQNELHLTGTVDLSKTNAIAGNLKLAADALDMTRYYDLFTNQPEAAAATPPPSAATNTVATNLNLEPVAVNLPFGKFTVNAGIGRFYLDEVDISNLQATVQFDGSHVAVNPCQLFLNGAPVKANVDLNLGVPGYQYDVRANADRIPIAPLADTFSPAYKNKARGDLLLNVQVKGAGITGTNLHKNLTGDVGLAITNADIQLVGPKIKAFVADIARVAMVAHVSGMGSLTNSALNRLDVRLKLGDGKIALTRCLALASVFRVIITGELPIAPVLDDSPFNDWPIHLAVGNGSAQNPDAMSNAGYARLPNFVALGGTLGHPEPVDLLLKEGTKAVKQGTKAVVNGTSKLKNWLEEHTSHSENTDTNQSGTNAPPAHHLFNFFKKKE